MPPWTRDAGYNGYGSRADLHNHLQTEQERYPGTSFPQQLAVDNSPLVIPIQIKFERTRSEPMRKENQFITIPYLHDKRFSSPRPDWILDTIKAIVPHHGKVSILNQFWKHLVPKGTTYNVDGTEGGRVFQKAVVVFATGAKTNPVKVEVEPSQFGLSYLPVTLDNLGYNGKTSSGVVVQFCLKGPGRKAAAEGDPPLMPWEFQKAACLKEPTLDIKTWVILKGEKLLKDFYLKVLGVEEYNREILLNTSSNISFSRVQIVTYEGLEPITKDDASPGSRELIRQTDQAEAAGSKYAVTVFVMRNPYIVEKRREKGELEVDRE